MEFFKSHSWWIVVLAISAIGVFSLTSRNQGVTAEDEADTSVWAVDVVRTLPGMQSEYIRNIEANWGSARRIARERAMIVSYHALAAETDSVGEWDIILITEYPDSLAWANREAAFQEVFASPEYVRTPIDTPSSELRSFVEGGGAMRTVVASP